MSKFRVVKHQLPCSYIRDFPGGMAGEQEELLHLEVNQYIPLNNPTPKVGDVTIIGTHANGFPKELYEALWDDLIDETEKSDVRIRSIWIADSAHQGQSGVLNEQLLGNDPGWYDHARDLTHLINLKRGDMPRPIVGVGHSVGGNQLVNVALWNPRLFTSLILFDPIIQEKTVEPQVNSLHPTLAQLSTFRRDIWPSREEAAKSFLKSSLYQRWDPRVFKSWIEHGLRELPTLQHPLEGSSGRTRQVTLTTTVASEVHTFLRSNFEGYGEKTGKSPNKTSHPDLDPAWPNIYPFYRSEPRVTLSRLPQLRPSVLYIFGETSNADSPASIKRKVEMTGIGTGGSGGEALGRVCSTTFRGIGHLIPMEATKRSAQACASWLDSELIKWREEETRWKVMWQGKTLKEKQGLDDKWREMMGGNWRAAARRNKL